MVGLRASPDLLSVVQAWELVQMEEALIVDLRRPSEFARGHPKGALSLPHSEKGLEDRLGVLLQPGSPVILLAETPRQTQSAVLQLQESAFPLVGVIEDTLNSWGNSGLPTEVLTEISVVQLADGLPGNDVIVLDVREPIEWATGHIPGALLISLSTLRDRLHELPLSAGITVICEAGVRSSSAASILQAEGFAAVVNVPEGTGGYRKAGLPLEYFLEEIGND
jgi:hydroxyacylglutathione hydrolase